MRLKKIKLNQVIQGLAVYFFMFYGHLAASEKNALYNTLCDEYSIEDPAEAFHLILLAKTCYQLKATFYTFPLPESSLYPVFLDKSNKLYIPTAEEKKNKTCTPEVSYSHMCLLKNYLNDKQFDVQKLNNHLQTFNIEYGKIHKTFKWIAQEKNSSTFLLKKNTLEKLPSFDFSEKAHSYFFYLADKNHTSLEKILDDFRHTKRSSSMLENFLLDTF